MGNFKSDLDIGEIAQDFISKQLEGEFGKMKVSKGLFKDYDLVSNDGYTIEVKLDKKSRSTNNVAIEYKYKNKPSGISTTKAMEWIHIFYLNGWVYCRTRREDLRNFIRTNIKSIVKTKGGDDNMSDILLIRKDDFVDRFNYIPINQGRVHED